MTVPVSSLSVAIQGVANFLDQHFGEDVVITVDSPQRASETAKSSSKHVLNLFAYRVQPSGFHAATSTNDTDFIRAHILVTSFLAGQSDDSSAAPGDSDLRILGHVIRVFHGHPVVPGPASLLPGNPVAGDAADFRNDQPLEYRLQVVLQTPTMEELNHIWTTQGGDLAYRLSVAYELALIPVEPLARRAAPPPTTTTILDVEPNTDRGRLAGFIDYGDETTAIPVGGIGAGNPPPPTNWLPVVLLAEGAKLSNSRSVAPGTGSVDIALAGPPGERVALQIAWTRSNGSEDTQAAQVFDVRTHLVDHASARHALNLHNAAAGDRATILARPANAGGQPLPTSPYANTLALEVA